MPKKCALYCRTFRQKRLSNWHVKCTSNFLSVNVSKISKKWYFFTFIDRKLAILLKAIFLQWFCEFFRKKLNFLLKNLIFDICCYAGS